MGAQHRGMVTTVGSRAAVLATVLQRQFAECKPKALT